MVSRYSTNGSPLKRAFGYLSRSTLTKRILFGYITLLSLLLFNALFALVSLEHLSKINKSIVTADIPVAEISDKMLDTLLEQELYGRRALIMRSSEMFEIFKKRGDDFRNLLQSMNVLPEKDHLLLQRIHSLHAAYGELFSKRLSAQQARSTASADRYDELIRQTQGHLSSLLKKISSDARRAQNEKNVLTSAIGKMVVQGILALCMLSIVIAVATTISITKNISNSLRALKHAIALIADGKFDNVPVIRTHDELGDLSTAFNDMAKRLKRLEEIYLDTSPLTRLPGGIAIESVLKKKLDTGSPLAFCLIDLDHFKAFNDHYGYARGNEVILETARVIDNAVKEHGSGDDFIGHIGGDDFVVITSPERHEKICSAIVDGFDRTIPHLYDRGDRERGRILGKTRSGEEVTFPIMTVSIGVVVSRQHEARSHLKISEIAAELKHHAKSLPGSVYVVDKRTKDRCGDRT